MNFQTRLFMAKVSWLLLFLLPLAAFAQSDAGLFPPKPEPAVYVHDYSGWLQPNQISALEQKLRNYWDSTSTQVVVMIRPDIGDYDKASYAFELGNRWGIGRKDKNNGVVMLIKSEAPDRGICPISRLGRLSATRWVLIFVSSNIMRVSMPGWITLSRRLKVNFKKNLPTRRAKEYLFWYFCLLPLSFFW